jgi:hypothetical protein
MVINEMLQKSSSIFNDDKKNDFIVPFFIFEVYGKVATIELLIQIVVYRSGFV